MNGVFIAVILTCAAVGLSIGFFVVSLLFRGAEMAEKKPFEQKDKRQQKLVETELEGRNDKRPSAKSSGVVSTGTSQVSSAISQLPVDDVTAALSRQLSRVEDATPVATPVNAVQATNALRPNVAPGVDDMDFDPDLLASSVHSQFPDATSSSTASAD